MKAKFRPIVVCIGVIVVLSLAWSVYAQPFTGMPQRDSAREAVGGDLIKELGLSPQQLEQIKKQRGEDSQKSKALRERLTAKASELKEELDKKKVNKKKINKILAEIKGLMGQQIEQHVGKILSIREILTPEQYEKLKAKLERKNQQLRQRMRHLKQRGQERQRPGGFWQRMWGRDKAAENQPTHNP